MRWPIWKKVHSPVHEFLRSDHIHQRPDGGSLDAGHRAIDRGVARSDVDGLRTVARQLSPSLAALALETDGAAAKANGADALDDPTISDSYQYYKDPGLFSAHTIMLSQAFPLWGKRDLRREAALADLDAARGQERAAQDELDERIKVAYAQYYLVRSEMTVNQEAGDLNRRMQSAASARYSQGSGDQTPVIQAFGEETNTKAEAIRLEGEENAIRARLNVLIGRSAEDRLAKPLRLRPLPGSDPVLSELVDLAHAANSTLSSGNAAIAAAKLRRNLADKSWYPDLTVGGGPLIQTNNRSTGFAATVGLNIPVPWGRESSGSSRQRRNWERRSRNTMLPFWRSRERWARP